MNKGKLRPVHYQGGSIKKGGTLRAPPFCVSSLKLRNSQTNYALTQHIHLD